MQKAETDDEREERKVLQLRATKVALKEEIKQSKTTTCAVTLIQTYGEAHTTWRAPKSADRYPL